MASDRADQELPRRLAAILERQELAFERQAVAFERQAASFDRHAASFDRQEATLERQGVALEAVMARMDTGFERTERLWGKNLSAMNAILRSLEDLSDQVRSNTRAVLKMLDRFGEGGQTA